MSSGFVTGIQAFLAFYKDQKALNIEESVGILAAQNDEKKTEYDYLKASQQALQDGYEDLVEKYKEEAEGRREENEKLSRNLHEKNQIVIELQNELLREKELSQELRCTLQRTEGVSASEQTEVNSPGE